LGALLVGGLVAGGLAMAAPSPARPAMMGVIGGSAVSSGPVAEVPVVEHPNGIIEGMLVQPVESPPLRDLKPIPPAVGDQMRPSENDSPAVEDSKPVKDAVVQDSFTPNLEAALAMPAPSLNFVGNNNRNGVYPPDTTGEAGPNHYVQWVNLSFKIFNKSGATVYGPANGNTLWSALGGPCASQNAGDPLVIYDQLAGRWVLSQFTSSSPYGECIAVSKTNDPTGAYWLYFFQHSTTVFYDYPHMGVWPDGYYTTFNRFSSTSSLGAVVVVYDRAKMLAGQAASFQAKTVSSSYGTLQPVDVDGSTLPPSGSAHISISRSGTSGVNFWKFKVNWTTPSSSTFTGPTTVGVAAYNYLCSGTRNCIPQPGTSVGLDGLGDRFMYRAAYRNFGTYQSVVASQNVNVTSTGKRAGVRWYEFRNVHSTPSVYQQSTYSPDTNNRWLGSIAQDKQGNMALGYSIASGSVYAGLRYTGRLVTDALSSMAQGETSLVSGAGAQTGTGYRFGDYSHLSVDPVDDCSFWFTSEYMPSTGTAPWTTRIGKFKFAGCQ
jgi:hypothetical protein